MTDINNLIILKQKLKKIRGEINQATRKQSILIEKIELEKRKLKKKRARTKKKKKRKQFLTRRRTRKQSIQKKIKKSIKILKKIKEEINQATRKQSILIKKIKLEKIRERKQFLTRKQIQRRKLEKIEKIRERKQFLRRKRLIRRNVLANKKVPTFRIEDTQKYTVFVRDLIKDIRGKIKVLAYRNNELIKEEDYNIQINPNRWWTNQQKYNDWIVSYSEPLLQPGDRIIILRSTRLLPTENIIQYFRLPTLTYSHCFLDPIHIYFEERKQTDEIKRKINIINELKLEYSEGVPENKIQEIAEKLKSTIKVQNIIQNNIKTYKSSSSKWRFDFINTKFNHVDFITSSIKRDIVDEELMRKIYKKLNKEKRSFSYVGTYLKMIQINYLNHQTVCKPESSEVFEKFEDSINIKNKYKIDYIRNPELSNYIKDGTHISSYMKFSKYKEQELKYLDHVKSYTQFKSNNYYLKFPTIFTDMRKMPNLKLVDLIKLVYKNVGFYTLTDINFDKCSDIKKFYFKKLNIRDSVYSSPFILFLYFNGVRFNITEGAWGVTTFDFEFSKEMLKKTNGISYYAKWSGLQGSMNPKKRINFKCYDKQTAQLIINERSDAKYYEDFDEVQIFFNKEKCFHRCHILGYIASYSQISVMEQLFHIPQDKIYKIVGDGIFYYNNPTPIKINKNFVFKEIKFLPSGFSINSFLSYTDLRGKINAPYLVNEQLSFYNGVAGGGKTRNALLDRGFINPVLTSSAWKLLFDKKIEFGIDIEVFFNFVKETAEKVNGNTLIFDELPMANKLQFLRFRNFNPDLKIIGIGDLNKDLKCYQTCDMKSMIDFSMFKIIKSFNIPHRFEQKDPIIEVFWELRDIFDRYMNDKKIINSQINYIKNIIPKDRIIKIDQLKEKFQNDDWILVSRSKCSVCKERSCKHSFKKSGNSTQKYNTLMKKKNAKNRYMYSKKHFVEQKEERQEEQKEVYNGSITYSKKKPAFSNLAYAITIHKMTGITIEKNIFIDLSQIYNTTLIYTAVSRAKRLDQIWLIEK